MPRLKNIEKNFIIEKLNKNLSLEDITKLCATQFLGRSQILTQAVVERVKVAQIEEEKRKIRESTSKNHEAIQELIQKQKKFSH